MPTLKETFDSLHGSITPESIESPDDVVRIYEEHKNQLGIRSEEVDELVEAIYDEAMAQNLHRTVRMASLMDADPLFAILQVGIDYGLTIGIEHSRNQADEMRQRIEGEDEAF